MKFLAQGPTLAAISTLMLLFVCCLIVAVRNKIRLHSAGDVDALARQTRIIISRDSLGCENIPRRFICWLKKFGALE